MIQIVNFDNEATVGTPAVDIVRVLWLQARNNYIEALEDYIKKSLESDTGTLTIIHARLITYFMEIQAYLKRTMKPEEYEKIRADIFADKIKLDRVVEIGFIFNEELDKVKLLKIDTRKTYDKQSWEAENKAMEL